MRFTSAAIQVLALAISSSADSEFSAYETKLMKAFDWCTGGENPIHWIDKSDDAWHANVKDGARFAPERNDKGKIDDLDKFVKDRLETIPTPVANEALPALIIENHCASVETPTEDCIFDFAGTPAPEQWALQDGIEGIMPSAEGNVPAEITMWERKKEMTVVFVPASDSHDKAKEITKDDPDKPKLADLKVRGNSSRKIPKKQLQLKLPKGHAFALIPGEAEARKWVISAYPSDPSYVENGVVFESYRRIGNLQKQYSPDWPSDGSVEDLAAQAWSPGAQPVNLILQGRYVGVYNIVDKVDLDNRVWIPEELNSKPESTPRVIDDIKLPSGSYFLGFDWTEQTKKEINPDRVISGEEDEFYTPNHQGGYQSNAWTIDGPDDKSFADYETDEDIALLQSFLLKLDELLQDPKGNDELLSQVIDMRSMARYFLMAEIAREADEYGGSMFFKYVDGKLYHAAPWDYAGTSYPTEACGPVGSSRYYGVSVDWETDTYAEFEPCDASTGNMRTAGWHVDSLFFFNAIECITSPEACNKGEPVKENLRWFFMKLFHTPSLQSEFWALWDIVVEHGLVESATGSGDIFSQDLMIDELFQPQKVAAAVDRQIWYAQMALIQTIGMAPEGVVPNVDSEVCTPILYESLRASVHGDDVTEPYLIPAKDWMFHKAAESGDFVQFYENANVNQGLLSYFQMYLDNDALISQKKAFIKHRLDWIATQRPTTSNDTSKDGGRTSTEPILVEQDSVVGLRGA